MAANTVRWVRNLQGHSKPLVMLGKFQAGSVQAIKRGELLELTGDTNTRFVPLDGDFDMSGGDVAIANEEIKDGDRAGFYEIIVPRPGDVFEFSLNTASNPQIGASVYYHSSEAVKVSGTNILGKVAGQDHYPLKQGHLADDGSPDSGEVIRNTAHVLITINKANSYYSRLQA